MIATRQEIEIAERLEAYQQDPIGFMVNCLDVKREHIWSKMVDVAESVRDNQFTAVPAGHDVSKTYTAGRIAVWFKSCFQPSTVITTAPSDNQVRNQLWREIHAAYAGAKVPLGGNMTSLMWDVKPRKDILEQLPPEQRGLWEKNFAIGFSTSPDTVTEHATKMQGWHNRWLLVILDEAYGIMPQIWRTVMEGLMVNERCKVLAIGNPTDPLSEMAQATKDPDWNVIRISVKDTPNYIEDREVIPGVAGRAFEARIRKKGVNSNAYKIRVLGEEPEYREGTYYGKEIALAKQRGQIGSYPHDPTAKVYNFYDLGDMYNAGLYVQFLREKIRIIDCYWDNTGGGIPALAAANKVKDYIYGQHFCGPDLETSNRKAGSSGMETRHIAEQLGMRLEPVLPHKFNDGIEAVRGIFPLLEINKPLCKVFLDALKGYRKKKDELLSTDEQPCYHEHPVPRWWGNHLMDALRHLAMAYRYEVIGGLRLGYPGSKPTIRDPADEGVVDLLEV